MSLLDPSPSHGNPLGVSGIEFIEYATAQPQALGSLLQQMGFVPIARHRSREVTLFRQGTMNMIVNADPAAVAGQSEAARRPMMTGFALRVRDAGAAWQRALDLGAWDIPTRASAMELNIPGIRGVGDSQIYFVDRHGDFSIYDVDFVPLPAAEQQPPALAGMHYFGVVQTVGLDRTPDWIDFYRELLGFSELPEGKYFGVMPKGTLLESPSHNFYLQLVEPPLVPEPLHWDERLIRVGIGARDVLAAVRELQARDIVFVDHDPGLPSKKGALTQIYLGGLTFELVVSDLADR
jgi:4-hydroxyphenylpyruvate dioxygenase